MHVLLLGQRTPCNWPVSQIAVVALMFSTLFLRLFATALFGGRMNNCYICDHVSRCFTVPRVNATLGLPMLSALAFPIERMVFHRIALLCRNAWVDLYSNGFGGCQ